jgi:hypothetical protein
MSRSSLVLLVSSKERNTRIEPNSETDAQQLSRVKDWVKWVVFDLDNFSILIFDFYYGYIEFVLLHPVAFAGMIFCGVGVSIWSYVKILLSRWTVVIGDHPRWSTFNSNGYSSFWMGDSRCFVCLQVEMSLLQSYSSVSTKALEDLCYKDWY